MGKLYIYLLFEGSFEGKQKGQPRMVGVGGGGGPSKKGALCPPKSDHQSPPLGRDPKD